LADVGLNIPILRTIYPQDRAIWSSEILLKLMIKPMIVATIGWSEEDDLNIPRQKRKLSVYSVGISQEIDS
jgi:hypothetical protein